MPLSGERFIDVEGIGTRYFDKGEGETVVLFHGGNFGSNAIADSADDWDLNFDGLARWCRVVAIDKLGQGYTDNPKSDGEYTMHAVVQHAYRTLRALGIAGAHLVGHSRGGYLVCRLTVEHPEIVKTCTIVDSNSCAPGTGRNEIVFANAPKPALSRDSQRWVLENYSYDPGCVTDEWVDAMVAIAEQPRYREAVAKMTGQGLLHTRFQPDLLIQKEEMFRIIGDRGIQRPVMQIWGANDPTVPREQALALYRILAATERRARMHIFNQAGHFSFREHPERFNDVLGSFIHDA